MKRLLLYLLLVLFGTCTLNCEGEGDFDCESDLQPEDFYGEVLFKDGTTISYDSLWSSYSGDNLLYSVDLSQAPMDWQESVKFYKMEGIEFMELSAGEMGTIQSDDNFQGVRKAAIRRTNGTVQLGFIYCLSTYCTSADDGADISLADEIIDTISITVSVTVSVEECE